MSTPNLLPKKEVKEILSVQIEKELLKDVKLEAEKNGLKLRAFIEAAFKHFLKELKK